MITASIIADSMSPARVRLTTFVLTYPRMIHSEFMTHRVFSRNASSSRAIPVKRQIQEVIDNPVIPLKFTKNQKGMQGGGEIADTESALKTWLEARDAAVTFATKLSDLEVHKQYANRILEPWAHITVVCTATDFNNWFALRYHSAAQPEIRELAKQMWGVYQESTPKEISAGQWHLPFVTQEVLNNHFGGRYEMMQEVLIKRSVARCARVSYKNHDGTDTTVEQDLQLYDRLLGSVPIHASPAEHQAMAVGDHNVRSGNFRGWIQYRKTLDDENIGSFTGPLDQND